MFKMYTFINFVVSVPLENHSHDQDDEHLLWVGGMTESAKELAAKPDHLTIQV